jgi:hypothetical protein
MENVVFALAKYIFRMPNGVFSCKWWIFRVANGVFSCKYYIFRVENVVRLFKYWIFCVPNVVCSCKYYIFCVENGVFSNKYNISLNNNHFTRQPVVVKALPSRIFFHPYQKKSSNLLQIQKMYYFCPRIKTKKTIYLNTNITNKTAFQQMNRILPHITLIKTLQIFGSAENSFKHTHTHTHTHIRTSSLSWYIIYTLYI